MFQKIAFALAVAALCVTAHCLQLKQSETKAQQPFPPSSGPSDNTVTVAAAELRPAASQVQQTGTCSFCPESQLNWPIGSAYCWNIRDSEGNEQGPGNNIFRTDGVSVARNGQLILEVRTNQDTGEFSCAEVYLDRSLGFGDYVWTVATDPSLIHPGLVASPFIYANDTQEFDIEFARWGDPAADNSNYVVQPASESKPGSYKSFTISGTRTTHRLRWGGPRLSQMRFESWSDSGKLLRTWTPTAGNPIINPADELAHINHWIFDKEADGLPASSKFVLNCFKFCPLARQETCSTPLGKRPTC